MAAPRLNDFGQGKRKPFRFVYGNKRDSFAIYMEALGGKLLEKEEEKALTKSIKESREALEDIIYMAPYGRKLIIGVVAQVRSKKRRLSKVIALRDVKKNANSEAIRREEFKNYIERVRRGRKPATIRSSIDKGILHEDAREELLDSFRSRLEEYVEEAATYCANLEQYKSGKRKSYPDLRRCRQYKDDFLVHPTNAKAFYQGMLALEELLEEDTHLMATKNLRMVVGIALTYMNKGIRIEDLVQVGNLGLLKAIERFEIGRGYRFSTYATWWIKHAIRVAMEKRSVVSMKPGAVRIVNKIINAENTCETIHGPGEATPERIAEHAKLTLKKVNKFSPYIPLRNTVSLSSPVRSSNDKLLGDHIINIADEGAISALEKMEKEAALRALKEARRNLTEQQNYILDLRYADDKLTLREIAAKFKMSRERIRQIQREAESDLLCLIQRLLEV